MKTEVREKRDLNTKHFDKGDGTFEAQAHSGHIHYFNKLGVGDSKDDFRSIDWTLSPVAGGGWTFEITAGDGDTVWWSLTYTGL